MEKMFEMGTFCVPGKKRRRQRRKNRKTIFSLSRKRYRISTGIIKIENKFYLDELLFILPTEEKREGGTFVPRVFGTNKKMFFKKGGGNGGRKFNSI